MLETTRRKVFGKHSPETARIVERELKDYAEYLFGSKADEKIRLAAGRVRDVNAVDFLKPIWGTVVLAMGTAAAANLAFPGTTVLLAPSTYLALSLAAYGYVRLRPSEGGIVWGKHAIMNKPGPAFETRLWHGLTHFYGRHGEIKQDEALASTLGLLRYERATHEKKQKEKYESWNPLQGEFFELGKEGKIRTQADAEKWCHSILRYNRMHIPGFLSHALGIPEEGESTYHRTLGELYAGTAVNVKEDAIRNALAESSDREKAEAIGFDAEKKFVRALAAGKPLEQAIDEARASEQPKEYPVQDTRGITRLAFVRGLVTGAAAGVVGKAAVDELHGWIDELKLRRKLGKMPSTPAEGGEIDREKWLQQEAERIRKQEKPRYANAKQWLTAIKDGLKSEDYQVRHEAIKSLFDPVAAFKNEAPPGTKTIYYGRPQRTLAQYPKDHERLYTRLHSFMQAVNPAEIASIVERELSRMGKVDRRDEHGRPFAFYPASVLATYAFDAAHFILAGTPLLKGGKVAHSADLRKSVKEVLARHKQQLIDVYESRRFFAQDVKEGKFRTLYAEEAVRYRELLLMVDPAAVKRIDSRPPRKFILAP